MRLDKPSRHNGPDRKAKMLWAADCAERVLPFFEERYRDDDRPRKAIESLRIWARRGEVSMREIRATSLAAHAAARAATDPAARAAARAAGQAAATAHVQTHAEGAAGYAARAQELKGVPASLPPWTGAAMPRE
jgi:hypothetical protein